jgi:hypothetical protein
MSEIKESYPLLFAEDSNTSAFEQVCDIFIAWTMRCAEKKYTDQNPCLNKYAKRMISLFVAKNNDIHFLEGKDILEVKTYRQETISTNRRIDIRAVISTEDAKYQIFIENKFDDVMQEEQLRAYKAIVPKKFCTQSEPVFIALNSGSTDDEKGKRLCEKIGFKFFYLCEIAAACFTDGKTENPFFDEFWFRWPEEAKKKSVS